MTIVNFDKFNLYEIPQYVLCNPDKSRLYALGSIVERKYSSRFNALSEISFKANKYIDNIEMPYYDYLVDRRLIYIEDIGYFQITKNVERGNGIEIYKEVIAQSSEVKLINKKLSLFKGTYKFYDAIDPTDTLMDKVLEYLPDWSIGTIDTEIAQKYRTFDVTDTNFYDFLMTKVENAYHCVFFFDTINQTISAYTAPNSTTNTDIYISYDNVIEGIDVEEINDALATSLTVLGAGDLSINQVNPLGTNNIYDFSYYKTTEWMSQELIDALDIWEDLIDANQPVYATTLTSLLDANEIKVDLKAGLVTLKGEYSALEQVKIVRMQQGLSLTEINAQLASKQEEIDNKKDEIAGINSTIKDIKSQLKVINDLVSFDSNFTESQILELQPYIVQNSYINENFVQTDIMSDAEIQLQAQGLYDQAVEILEKMSHPIFTFDVNSINFPLIKDFEIFTNQLELGAIVRLELKPGVVSYPVLLGFDLDYDNPENFKMIFGNRLRLDNSSFKYSDLTESITSATLTSKVNSIPWTDTTEYVVDTVSTFITSALNATTNNVISGSAQNITITESGLRGRQMSASASDVYSDKQLWLINNMLAFSDDGFQTSKLALGETTLPGGGTAFGLVADVIVGTILAGNQLTITNENNKFIVDGSGATLIDATLNITNSTNTNQILLDTSNGIKIRSNINGTWTDTFYADTAGNLQFKGNLRGATGTFSGTLNAATINGGTINGTTINAGVINGATGYFSGNIYASNLQGQVSDGQIQSVSWNKVTAVSINAGSITAGTMSADRISGGTLYSPYISGGTINSVTLNSSNIYGAYITGTTLVGVQINAGVLTVVSNGITTLNGYTYLNGPVYAGGWGKNTALSYTKYGGSLGHLYFNNGILVDYD